MSWCPGDVITWISFPCSSYASQEHTLTLVGRQYNANSGCGAARIPSVHQLLSVHTATINSVNVNSTVLVLRPWYVVNHRTHAAARTENGACRPPSAQPNVSRVPYLRPSVEIVCSRPDCFVGSTRWDVATGGVGTGRVCGFNTKQRARQLHARPIHPPIIHASHKTAEASHMRQAS